MRRVDRQDTHRRVWPTPPRVPQPTQPALLALVVLHGHWVSLGHENTMTLWRGSPGLPWGQGYVFCHIWFRAQTQNGLAPALPHPRPLPFIRPGTEGHLHKLQVLV